MTKDELIAACNLCLEQGVDFMPIVLGKGVKSNGYKKRALGQLCEILCVNSEGEMVVRASARKTLEWIRKCELTGDL